MYPMGGMNVGGINVGGMYGGAIPKMYLTAQDKAQGIINPAYAALSQAKQAQYARARASASQKRGVRQTAQQASMAQQLAEYEQQGLTKAQAKKVIQINRLKESLARAEAPRPAGVGRLRKGVYKYLERGNPDSGINPAYQGLRSEFADSLARQRSRLSSKHLKSKEIPLDEASVMRIADALSAIGLGIHDLETGGAWYDDLWSGIKEGANVASHILPFVL